MRFRFLPLLAALLAAAASHRVAAQTAPPPLSLRGAVGDETAAAPAAASEDESGGRVLRQPPTLKGPEPDPLDDTITGTVARRGTIEAEEDPFAALGIRKGGFIFYPSLTATLGYSTNQTGAAGGGPGATVTLVPELQVKSDWGEHEATLTLRGSYAKFLDGSQADDPSGSVDATGRVDLKDGWNVGLAAGYAYSRQSISDPNFPAGVDSPPAVHDLSASAALNGRFGRKVFTLEGNFARSAFDNGTSAGLVVDQGYRTNTLFGARMRLGYETPLDVTPFVEGEIARRIYDRTLDNSGLRRSSLATHLRAGVAFGRDPVLSGEIAVGYGEQIFDDAGLMTLRALTVDGSLAWSPMRLVTIRLDAATSFSPSTDPASSGSVVHDASVNLDYALRRDFTLGWTGAISREEFQGTGTAETSLKAGVSATWKLSRRVWLTGGYIHEWMDSTDAGGSFQSDSLRLELRLQR